MCLLEDHAKGDSVQLKMGEEIRDIMADGVMSAPGVGINGKHDLCI